MCGLDGQEEVVTSSVNVSEEVGLLVLNLNFTKYSGHFIGFKESDLALKVLFPAAVTTSTLGESLQDFVLNFHGLENFVKMKWVEIGRKSTRFCGQFS